MIKLGDKVKDKISGFEGLATARSEFLYGCVRILVEPTGLKMTVLLKKPNGLTNSGSQKSQVQSLEVHRKIHQSGKPSAVVEK